MTGPDTPPRKKRRRRHTVKKPSIYLLPEPIHLSIGKTLAASRIRYDEGTPEAGPSRTGPNPVDTNPDEPGPSKGVKKTQQVGSNGTDAEGDPVEPGPTARPRGWAKKRLNEVAEAARMAEEIGGTDDDLPSDDLLRAIHRHAAELYMSHNLLLLPTKQTRYEQWESKKRLIVRQAALEQADKEARPVSVDSHSDEERGKRGTTVLTTASKDKDMDVKPVLSGTGGRKTYKKRDMRLGLDGGALLAFGLLVEELVIQELRDAGYEPPRENEEEGEDDATNNNDENAGADDNDDNEVEDEDEHENQSGDESGDDD